MILCEFVADDLSVGVNQYCRFNYHAWDASDSLLSILQFQSSGGSRNAIQNGTWRHIESQFGIGVMKVRNLTQEKFGV
jgi:hypothetical protein